MSYTEDAEAELTAVLRQAHSLSFDLMLGEKRYGPSNPNTEHAAMMYFITSNNH